MGVLPNITGDFGRSRIFVDFSRFFVKSPFLIGFVRFLSILIGFGRFSLPGWVSEMCNTWVCYPTLRESSGNLGFSSIFHDFCRFSRFVVEFRQKVTFWSFFGLRESVVLADFSTKASFWPMFGQNPGFGSIWGYPPPGGVLLEPIWLNEAEG